MTSLAADPSQTLTTRREYGQRLRGVLARVMAQARADIIERDVFELRNEATAARSPTPIHDLTFATDDSKIEQFQSWLDNQVRQGRLEVFTRDGNPYVRASYQRSLQFADARLREQGVDISDADLQATFNRPIHQESVQKLYTRNLTEWDGVTSAMSQQVSRELADGFAQGDGPRRIARRISDRVDKIGKTRATTLARTEVIRAHAEGTLNRFEEQGVEEVAGRAEFRTAQDERVCPICASMDGTVYQIENARGLIPVHARCRCVFLPVVDGQKQTTLSARKTT